MKSVTKIAPLLFILAMAATAAAGLEIKSYNVTPSPLRPGMSGSINLAFNNPSASESISDAFLTATASDFIFVSGVNVGDLGAQSSTLVSVPFKIKDEADAGQQIVSFTVGYTSSVGGTGLSKSFTVPVVISSPEIVSVVASSTDAESISPGDAFVVNATIENKGGNLKNVVLKLPVDSKFSLDGATSISLGSVQAKSTIKISIPLIANSEITPGYYAIPVMMEYDDAASADNSIQLQLGPLVFAAATSKVNVYARTSGASPGRTARLDLVVKNTGNSPLRNVKVALPDNSTIFVALDFTEKTIGDIGAGQEGVASFTVGIRTNLIPQAYASTFRINFESKSGGESIEKTVGVRIEGNPSVSVILETDPAPMTAVGKHTLSVQVSNDGDTALRALWLGVHSDDLEFIGPAESYIGTLNLDDYSTAQFTAALKSGKEPGTYPLEIRLSYKDSYNEPHNEIKTVSLRVLSPQEAARTEAPKGDNGLFFVLAIILLLAFLYFIVYKRFLKKAA